MSQADSQKLLDKGFMIIRVDLFRRQIKVKTWSEREWKTLEKGFQSKAATTRRAKELLNDSMTIEG